MDQIKGFRTRLRFRLQKRLNIKDPTFEFEVGECRIKLSPQVPDVPISESDWLVMNATGFASDEAARVFGRRLKAAAEISSIASRLGIDTGVDLATAGFGQIVKDAAKAQSGLILRDNIHGIDVFPDDPLVRILHFNASGSVLKDPEPFLSDISFLLDATEKLSKNAKDVALLLNYALMRTEPVAQIVFAFSAVESLGQQENWTPAQKTLLDKLVNDAEYSSIGNDQERAEVVSAIKRGTHKLGLRQGALRLLESLNLNHLRAEWDTLYGQRSTLVHGLAPKPGIDYTPLAHRVVSLCGQILLKYISLDMPLAVKHIDKFYKI